MALTLHYLDENHKNEDAVIISGENILLKFVPKRSILKENPKLNTFIEIPDLLSVLNLDILKEAKEIVKSTKRLKEALGQYVNQSSKTQDGEQLEKYKSEIIKISEDIAIRERKIGIAFSDFHFLSFCTNCRAYIGEADNLTTICSTCNKPLEEGGRLQVSYLNKPILGFLEGGIWFEDYMEKLLRREDWEVWNHGSVMGVSGVLHPVDLLAIKDGVVFVAECKSGSVAPRDISHFLVQRIDIPSRLGFFFSMQDCSSKGNKALFRGDTVLLDNLEGKTDEEILELIHKHVVKFQ